MELIVGDFEDYEDPRTNESLIHLAEINRHSPLGVNRGDDCYNAIRSICMRLRSMRNHAGLHETMSYALLPTEQRGPREVGIVERSAMQSSELRCLVFH